MKQAIDSDPQIKLIFLCSPGNPTGTVIPPESIRSLLEYERFKGIVIVDEAYIDFVDDASKTSAVQLVKEYANLCVMQTLSKSFGLAAIRCVVPFVILLNSFILHRTFRLGIGLAQPPLIQILTNTKAPYNISTPTAHLALSSLTPPSMALTKKRLDALKSQKRWLLSALASPSLRELGVGTSIGSSDANFVLAPILERDMGSNRKPDSKRAQRVYKALAEEEGVVVRYRGNEPGCAGCLRITVGTEEENAVVIKKLEEMLRIM